MPNSKFKFCPYCGGELFYQKNSPHPLHPVCKVCHQVFWQTSHPTASCLILDKEKKRVLLGKRSIDPFKGWWDVPGGFLEPKETPLQGLKREMREELGVEIEPLDFVGVYIDGYGKEAKTTLAFYYSAKITKGTPLPQDDLAAIKWFDLNKTLPPIAFRSGKYALRDFKLKLKTPHITTIPNL